MYKTLVVIDDDVDDLNIMKDIIKDVDPTIRCTSFLYSEEAIRLIIKEWMVVPDYIIIDMNMPLKNGQECLIDLRKHELLDNTAIIIYSTTVVPALRSELLANGATHVFQKPVTINDWHTIVRKLIVNDWTF